MDKHDALVISSIKYGDADLIARLYVREVGLVSFMLKGVRKSKKGKFKTAYFQPLTQMEVVFTHRNKGTLEYLKDLKISYPYESMHQSLVKSSITLFFSEVLTQLITEQERDEKLFDYLILSFRLMDQEDEVANFPLKMMIDMTRFFGFFPSLSRKRNLYFNLEEASFEQEGGTPSHTSLNSSNVIRDLMGMDFDKVRHYKIGRQQRSETLRDLIRYYNIHQQSFKVPASLDILGQIFDD